MKTHAAIMVAPGNFSVSGSNGHVIEFEANQEVRVPASMVAACRQYGAREVRRFADIVDEVPDQNNRTMQPRIIATEVARSDRKVVGVTTSEQEAAAAEVKAKKQAEPPPPPKDDQSVRYTEKENQVKSALLEVLSSGGESDVTANGIPKVGAINAHLEFEVSAKVRDAVIVKMKRVGDLPEDFGTGESGD